MVVLDARVPDQAADQIVGLRDHALQVLRDLPRDRDVEHLLLMVAAILAEVLERL